jgi:HIT domain/HNH endonuclease
LPRARGGTDEPDNLQALCFSCNAAKRDRDATDFRGVRKAYDRREPRRPFCEIPYGLMMSETDLASAVRDAFPATPLHTLVIPKRHVSGYFDSAGRSSTPATSCWSKRRGDREGGRGRGGVQLWRQRGAGRGADGLPLPPAPDPAAQRRLRSSIIVGFYRIFRKAFPTHLRDRPRNHSIALSGVP